MARIFYRIERAMHMVDWYLARQRGDMEASIFSMNKARMCERKLDCLSIQ
jgi:hypothetical protein